MSSFSLNAQDILVRKGGEIENVKVLEVSPTEVKFKKSNNPDGPIFIEKRSSLYSIKYQNGEVQTFEDSISQSERMSIYKEYGKKKKYTHEAVLYIGWGLGAGYQFRREFNQYIGWNIASISYVTDLVNFGDNLFNIGTGVRGYTPAYNAIRGFADLNLGYTLDGLGMNFSLGIQVHKHYAIGYHLTYIPYDSGAFHMAKISFLF